MQLQKAKSPSSGEAFRPALACHLAAGGGLACCLSRAPRQALRAAEACACGMTAVRARAGSLTAPPACRFYLGGRGPARDKALACCGALLWRRCGRLRRRIRGAVRRSERARSSPE
ncbi:unnamed protein product [Amoebophrya sp. A120]|nr:unnamed protein product [Amoebophrya sp. A120]|eukprot:GSA120T00019137001.1